TFRKRGPESCWNGAAAEDRARPGNLSRTCDTFRLHDETLRSGTQIAKRVAGDKREIGVVRRSQHGQIVRADDGHDDDAIVQNATARRERYLIAAANLRERGEEAVAV